MERALTLASCFLVLAVLNCEQSTEDIMDDLVPAGDFKTVTRISPSDIEGGDRLGAAIDADGEFTAIGARGDDEKGIDAGAVYILQHQGRDFSNIAETLYPDEPTNQDGFGYSVGISGNTLIVGAPHNDKYGEDAGVAYLYQHLGGNQWSFIMELASPTPSAGDQFGWSVDIDQGVAAVGSWADAENYYDTEFIKNGAGVAQGSVFVYQESNNWELEQKLTPDQDQGHRWDNFGSSLTLNGSTIAVGARGTDNTSYEGPGSVYVFQGTNGSWTQTEKLEAADGQDEDFFGTSLCMDGGYLAVTASGKYNSLLSQGLTGTAYVFKKSGDTWSQETKLQAAGALPDDGFGEGGITMNQDFVVVGAPNATVSVPFNGEAYFFKRDGSWAESHKIAAPDPVAEDAFGATMTMTDDMLFVGAPRKCNGNGCLAGVVYFVY
ncbi:MAG: hypothetical protein ACR2MX_12900 [Cyclobacteriaceae bacterium]